MAWRGVQPFRVKFAAYGYGDGSAAWGYNTSDTWAQPRRDPMARRNQLRGMQDMLQGYGAQQGSGAPAEAEASPWRSRVLGTAVPYVEGALPYVEGAQPALTAAMAADTIRNVHAAVRGGGGVQGAGLALAGYGQDAINAARGAKTTNDAITAANAVREAASAAKGPLRRFGAKVIPGLNVVSSAAGLGTDAYDLATGKEYDAPDSTWGMVGQTLTEGMTPVSDAWAGASVAGIPGAAAAAGARALLNIGRVYAGTSDAVKAISGARESGAAAAAAAERAKAFKAYREGKGDLTYKDWKTYYASGQAAPAPGPTVPRPPVPPTAPKPAEPPRPPAPGGSAGQTPRPAASGGVGGGNPQAQSPAPSRPDASGSSASAAAR